MIKENSKYDRVMDILRKSKPVFNEIEAEAVSERIIRKIREEKSDISFYDLILDFLFGWVYIGWVRRSMVAAAFLLIVFFGYQQVVILMRINELSVQKIQNGIPLKTNFTDDISNYMKLYGITGEKFPDEKNAVSEKEIDQLIKSVNKLQVKYKDILKLIENDTQLKKYVEAKMKENLKR